MDNAEQFGQKKIVSLAIASDAAGMTEPVSATVLKVNGSGARREAEAEAEESRQAFSFFLNRHISKKKRQQSRKQIRSGGVS